MRIRFLMSLMLLSALTLLAQKQDEWQPLLYQLNEMEDMEATDWDNYYEFLCELEQNPLNINTATREELEQLPFLSATDVESISEYVYRYGPVKSLGELAMVKDLDYYKRRLLFYFTYAGDKAKAEYPKPGNILKYGRHDISATLKLPLYDRKGDEKGYLGYKYKHSVKYDFTYGDYFRLGFVGSQDAGEPFFAGRNRAGYDFYSFYIVARRMGRVKTLALGRYRVRFGMGLVINNNFGFGKLSALSTLGRGTNTIRAHSSRSDANYLQGAAATVNIVKGLDVSAFVSYRKIDATLNKNDSTITTIVTSGYHRTETEMMKKNNTTQTVAGGNIDFRWNGFSIGATAVYTTLDRELKPNTRQIYRKHYAAGNNFYNLGVNYSYTGHRFTLSGEAATGDCNAVATVNTVSFRATDNVDLIGLYRFYSYRYYALFARSFSEGGAVQNENGVYVGVNWRPMIKLNVMAYSDFAYFAWPKYQASNSSRASDNLLQLVYTPSQWSFLARYRLKIKERDNDDKTRLICKTEHRGRVSATYSDGKWNVRSQADLAFNSYKRDSFGWMVSENVGCSAVRNLQLYATIGYFDTQDYDSRVYVYERGLYQVSSFPMFYGNGMRTSLLANFRYRKLLMLTAKIGMTKYFDRDKISSGLQQIDSSTAADVELQIRLRL